jgi:hypothetical protein
MKTKLTIMDIKQALYKKEFRELFPNHKEGIERVLKDPGCACNVQFIRELMKHKDKLQQYFPDKEIVLPEEEPRPPNDWGVINCPITQLEDKMRKIPVGKRLVAAARWKDRVTVILNDAVAFLQIPQGTPQEHLESAKKAKMNWKIINTTIHDLIHELHKLPQGRKLMALTRWQDQITVIVNDMETLF